MSSHKNTENRHLENCAKLLKNAPSYVKQYVRSIHYSTAPRTQEAYVRDIMAFLSYIDDRIDVSNIKNLERITKEDFEEYFEYLERYEKDGREITNGRESIKRKISALRNFFAYLFESGQIPSDEIRKLRIPKPAKKNIIRMDNDEAHDFIKEVTFGNGLTQHESAYHQKYAIRDITMLRLMISTGIRVSECAELDVKDVDMKNCSIHIIRKGGNEATIYFPDSLTDQIREYLEYRKNISGVADTETALFLSNRKQRIAVRTIEHLVKKYASRSVPSKHITPHKLRSTYATELYKATGDIYLVAEALGHNDVTTTKNHYAEISDEHKRKNRNKVSF